MRNTILIVDALSEFSHGLLAAVFLKSDQLICSDRCLGLPLPAPAEQTQRSEAASE
jgi:hypothetical protein